MSFTKHLIYEERMSFKINLKTCNSNTITIENDRINKNLEIWMVKHMIRIEMKWKNNVKFDLMYNDVKMNDDDILNDYNVNDSKNLIEMVIHVDKSSECKGTKASKTFNDIVVATPDQIVSFKELQKCINQHQKTLQFLDNFENS